MLCNLIFGLILVMIVLGSEGSKWTGTFQLQGNCNTTDCCCPSKQLVIQKANDGVITGSVETNGANCPTAKSFTVADANTSSVDDKNLGQFNMENDDTMEVTFYQNKNLKDTCKVNMTRQNSQGGGKGPSSKPGDSSASGSEALLNHGSISIKFISIVMITIIITHI